jgi:hypothetical protein
MFGAIVVVGLAAIAVSVVILAPVTGQSTTVDPIQQTSSSVNDTISIVEKGVTPDGKKVDGLRKLEKSEVKKRSSGGQSWEKIKQDDGYKPTDDIYIDGNGKGYIHRKGNKSGDRIVVEPFP